MLDIVQAEPYAPLHVRKAVGRRGTMVENADGDAANEAALAQPELPDENVVDDDEEGTAIEATSDVDAQPEVTAEAGADHQPSAEAADVSKSNIETNDT
jgi:hypothetical protein